MLNIEFGRSVELGSFLTGGSPRRLRCGAGPTNCTHPRVAVFNSDITIDPDVGAAYTRSRPI